MQISQSLTKRKNNEIESSSESSSPAMKQQQQQQSLGGQNSDDEIPKEKKVNFLGFFLVIAFALLNIIVMVYSYRELKK